MFFWKKLPDESNFIVYQLRTGLFWTFGIVWILFLLSPVYYKNIFNVISPLTYSIILIIFLIIGFIGSQPVGTLSFIAKYTHQKYIKEGSIFNSNKPLTIKIEK